MTVLVDTSVWVRFLSNRAPHAAALEELLSRDEVSGHDCVYGELLIGAVGGRRQLLSDYEQMHQAPVVSHGEVVAFVRHRRLHGRGIGWIDAHLLGRSLIVNGHQCRICWTGHISNAVLFVLLLFRTPATSP